MKTLTAGIAAAALVGLASFAQAGQLLSPPLPTNSRINIAHVAACWVFNSGTSSVTPQVSLFSNNEMSADFDTCSGKPLAGGHTCIVSGRTPDDSFVACKVTASSVSKLRGSLEIREDTNAYKVLVGVELQ